MANTSQMMYYCGYRTGISFSPFPKCSGHISETTKKCFLISRGLLTIYMWEPYKSSIEKYLPNADIVHDKFHIIGYLTKAVDSVRKQENKLLRKEGHDYLVGTKYFWLTNKKNWGEKHKQIYQLIKNIIINDNYLDT